MRFSRSTSRSRAASTSAWRSVSRSRASRPAGELAGGSTDRCPASAVHLRLVEAEAELAEHQQLVADQRRRPAARARRRLDRGEQAVEALDRRADKAGPRARRRRSARVAHSIPAEASGSESRKARLWTSSTVRWASCSSVRARIFGLDEVAGDQHRPQPPRLAAADIAGLEPVVGRQRPDDRAMLAMRADGDDDGGRFRSSPVSRPGGNSRRPCAPRRRRSGRLLEILERGVADRPRRAEMHQQGALAARADAGDLVERAGGEALGALRPVGADREAVGLVAQPLEVEEQRRIGREA